MHIPKQEDFAVLLMSELGRVYPKRWLSISEVSERHGVSPLYLKKIVRLLHQAKLVTSKEGVGGGYVLAKHPEQITVWEVMRAVSGSGQLVSPNERGAVCPLYSACLPQHIKKTIAQSLEQSLSGITLQYLIST